MNIYYLPKLRMLAPVRLLLRKPRGDMVAPHIVILSRQDKILSAQILNCRDNLYFAQTDNLKFVRTK